MFSSKQKFNINGEDNESLAKALQLALDLSERTIEAFYEDKNGLVFCSYNCEGCTKYPFEATVPILVEHAAQYLTNLPIDDKLRLAGEEPDMDGGAYLGWEVFHPLWYGENELENYNLAAVIAVRPCWIVYGK